MTPTQVHSLASKLGQATLGLFGKGTSSSEKMPRSSSINHQNSVHKEDTTNNSYGDMASSRHLLRGYRSKPSKHTTEQASPVFVQFLDCIYQIMQQNPTSFEFNESFLIRILQLYYSGVTRTFMGDYEKERVAIYRNIIETYVVILTLTLSLIEKIVHSNTQVRSRCERKCGRH